MKKIIQRFMYISNATARNPETGLPVKYDERMSIMCYVEE